MNIKSPLTYPGSKIWAIDKILPLVPRFEIYREPFVGGLNVFLAIRQDRGINKRYWINDLYTTLYNFYIQTQQNPEYLRSDTNRRTKNLIIIQNDYYDI